LGLWFLGLWFLDLWFLGFSDLTVFGYGTCCRNTKLANGERRMASRNIMGYTLSFMEPSCALFLLFLLPSGYLGPELFI
jgi:hypothetical protein